MKARQISTHALGLLVLAACGVAAAAKPEINTNGTEVAIGGYDPVAYFTESAPIKGEASHSLEWRGAEWHFANADHLARFKSNPEKYAPRYGGYCAYAVAKGSTARIEPAAWTIRDGRLYLNYNTAVRERWQQNADTYISRADRNWPKVLQ